jgi:uncharacterized repeat protein (TIGR03803 family)
MRTSIYSSIILTLSFILVGLQFTIAQTAISFNGLNATNTRYLDGTFANTANLTIEMDLFYKGGNAGFDRFFSLPNNGYEMALGTNGNLWVWPFSNTWVSTGYTVPLNQWVHLAFVRNAGVLTIYVNGVQIASHTITSDESSSQFSLGRNRNNTTENANVDIDNFRIWSVARTATQIEQNYQVCMQGDEPNLIVYYDFENITGNTVPDLAGGDNNGTLVNGVVVVDGVSCDDCVEPEITISTTSYTLFAPASITLSATASAGSVKWYDAQTEGNLLFTGENFETPIINSTTSFWAEADNNGCVSLGRTEVLVALADPGLSVNGNNQSANFGQMLDLSQSVTVEVWIKPNGNVGTNTWHRFIDAHWQQNFALNSRLNHTNSLNLSMGGTEAVVTANNVIVPNEWQHIAFTYNHTTNQAKLFRNGQFLTQGTFTYTSPRNATSNILAGSSNTNITQGFNGAIDNVRLWNIARTEAEILASFETCLNGNEMGLIAYYDFDNVTENSIPNLVGANNTGTLENGAVIGEGVSCEGCVEPEVTVYTTSHTLFAPASTILTATASAGSVKWYDAETGGNLLFTGENFETPVINSTTSFWAEADNNGCVSLNRTEVVVNVQNCFAGGNGSTDNPYQIDSKHALKCLSENSDLWGSHFIQTADIIFNSADFTTGGDFHNNGSGFIPISNNNTSFSGTYNGNDFKIEGLEFLTGGWRALFYELSTTAILENINLIDFSITGNRSLAGLAITNRGLITNCFVSGTITGTSGTLSHSLGGIASGSFNSGIITNCGAEVSITANYGLMGGVVGVSTGGLDKVYANATLNGLDWVGGIAGSASLFISNLSNLYVIGEINGRNNVGGLFGEIQGGGLSITNSYVSATISGTNSFGPIIGASSSNNISNTYWNSTVSGINSASNGSPKTTLEMQNQSTFTNWDFDDVWQMGQCSNNGFPVFQWQTVEPLPQVDTLDDVVACDNYTLPALTNGAYFAQSGGETPIAEGSTLNTNQTIYIFAEVDGCKNESSFQVTIETPIVDTPDDVVACDNYTLPALTNGAYFAQAGGVNPIAVGSVITENKTIYVFNGSGTCSSEHSFTITVEPSEVVITQTACESFTWDINNQTYTTSGVYNASSSSGVCGLVNYELNLTILPPQTINQTQTASEPYFWEEGNQYLFATDNYSAVIQSPEGCDITVNMDFTIVPPTWAANANSFSIDYTASNLVSDFIGVTENGGANGVGTIYSFDDTDDSFTKLYDFANEPDNRIIDPKYVTPYKASNGKVYGVSLEGGDNGEGTLFEVDLTSREVNVIHSFSAATGSGPMGGVLEHTPGILLGTTRDGGTNNFGVIYQFNLSTGTYTKLADFTGTNGANPNSLFTKGADNLYYGVTPNGGANSSGVFYQFNPTGNIITVKHNFDCSVTTDGCHPYSAPTLHSNGNLYGVSYGIPGQHGGSIYSFNTTTQTYLHQIYFTIGGLHASNPYNSLVERNDEILIGSNTPVQGFGYGRFGYNTLTNSVSPATDATIDDPQTLVASSENHNGFFKHPITGVVYQFGTQGVYIVEETNLMLFPLQTTLNLPTSHPVVEINPVFIDENTVMVFAKERTTLRTIIFSFNYTTGNTTIHYRSGNPKTSFNPTGSLVKASNGKYYGIAKSGGYLQGGGIYEFDRESNTVKTLYHINSVHSPALDGATGIIGPDGNFYYSIRGNHTTTAAPIPENGYFAKLDLINYEHTIIHYYTNTDFSWPLLSNANNLMVRENTVISIGFQGTRFFTYNTSNNTFEFTTDNGALARRTTTNPLLLGSTYFYGLQNRFLRGLDLQTNQIVKEIGTFPGVIRSLTNIGNNKLIASSVFSELIPQDIYEVDIDNNEINILLVTGSGNNLNNILTAPISNDDGILYGLSNLGGNHNKGAIYKYNLGTETYNLLHSFNSTLGENPKGQLLPSTFCQPSSTTYNITQCGSFSWPANNQTYTESGLYELNLISLNGCDSTIALNLTIIPTPNVDTPDNVTACSTYILPNLTNGNYFTEPNGLGTPLSSGQTLNSEQTVYVYSQANGCSNEHSFTVIFNAPTITSSMGAEQAGPGVFNLSATASEGVVKWYDAETGGNLLFTGENFETPLINSTTSFWAEADNNGCLSLGRTEVLVTISSCFAAGDGSTINPYQIATKEEWFCLTQNSNLWGDNFIVIDDISLTSADFDEGNMFDLWIGGVQGIGNIDTPFSGKFNGNGKVLDNFKIYSSSHPNVGLFGVTSSTAEISNIIMTNVEVSSATENSGTIAGINRGQIINCAVNSGVVDGYMDNIGGLVGLMQEGLIDNSSASLSVSSNFNNTGGLVGKAEKSNNPVIISNSSFNGTVINRNGNAGGIVGLATSSIFGNHIVILNSSSQGEVVGLENVGGLIGFALNVNISESNSSANISLNPDVGFTITNNRFGGLVGQINQSAVSNSFSTGNISGGNGVGGAFGSILHDVIISHVYTTGNVSGNQNIAGFSGSVGSSQINSCYSAGQVTGSDMAAGFTISVNMTEITNCYSVSNVIGNSKVAGFFIGGYGFVSNSYASGTVSGSGLLGGFTVEGEMPAGFSSNLFFNSTITGINNDDLADPLNEYEMRLQSSFDIWDFDDVWHMGQCSNNGYPIFSWQTVEPYAIITGSIDDSGCEGASLNLSASSDRGIINWYNTEMGGTPLHSGSTFNTPNLNATTSFWVTAQDNGCENVERVEVVATIIPQPAAPIVISTQIFVGNGTISDLSADGSEIEWFEDATAEIALASSTSLVSGSTYYAAQSNVCGAGHRVPVLVQRISDDEFEFCSSVPPTFEDISVTPSIDNSPKWFTSAAGGTELDSTTELSSGIYYLEQGSPAIIETLFLTSQEIHRPATVGIASDGRILFAAGRNLWRMNSDGTDAGFLRTRLGDPRGFAFDDFNHIIIARQDQNLVYRINLDDVVPLPQLGTGFSGPTAIAIQADGKILVADTDNNAIKRMDADGTNIITLGSGFSGPQGVAVQSDGKILVADTENNAIKRMDADGSNIVTLGSGFLGPRGLAIQADGKIIVADTQNNAVKRMNADGSNIVSIGSGFSNPWGLAIQPNGKILVADHGNMAIKRITEGSTSNRVAVNLTVNKPTHYRNQATGTWSTNSLWEKSCDNAATWALSDLPPTANEDVEVIIQNGTLVDINVNYASPFPLNRIVVEQGAYLTHMSSTNVTVNILDVYGEYTEEHSSSIYGQVNVHNEGVYRHSVDGGDLPAASWHEGSILYLDGVETATSLNGFAGQTYGNVVFNSHNTTEFSLSTSGNTTMQSFEIMDGGPGGKVTLGEDATLNVIGTLSTSLNTIFEPKGLVNIGGQLTSEGIYNQTHGSTRLVGSNNNQFVGAGHGGSITFNHLEIAKAQSYEAILSSNITVNGNLTLTAGDLNLSGRNITLNSSEATIVNENENHRIFDRVNQGSIIKSNVEIGEGFNQNIGGLGLTIQNNGGNMGLQTITRKHPVAENSEANPVGIGRVYEVSPGGNDLDLDLTVNYLNADLAVDSDPEEFFIYRYNPTTEVWDGFSGGTVNTTAKTFSYQGWSQFSEITVGNGQPNLLPVEMYSMQAECVNQGVLVTWVTASELNNHYFLVERSTDGQKFELVSQVFSASDNGNSSSVNRYELLDSKSLSGLNLYRITQVDYDGTTEVFEVFSASCGGSAKVLFEVFPNPASYQTTVIYTGDLTEQVTLQISDAQGRVVSSIPITQLQQNIEVNQLQSGVYLFRIIDKRNEESTQRVIVNRQ